MQTELGVFALLSPNVGDLVLGEHTHVWGGIDPHRPQRNLVSSVMFDVARKHDCKQKRIARSVCYESRGALVLVLMRT